MGKRVALNLEGTPEAPRRAIRMTQLREEMEALLEPRRAYAATAYGYIDPRLSYRTRCYVADSDTTDDGVLLEIQGRGSATLYTQGDPVAVASILHAVDVPRFTYLTAEQRHMELMQEHFVLRAVQRLARMRVDASTFVLPETLDARLLGPNDLNAANRLYASDSGAWLSRRHLTEQRYYGVWDNGIVVSIAGTQSISEEYRTAIVANVLTHPDYRGMGLATACVGALTADLLRQVRDVVLNVDPLNAPASAVYRRLGYQDDCRIIEAWAFWKGRNIFERTLAILMSWVGR